MARMQRGVKGSVDRKGGGRREGRLAKLTRLVVRLVAMVTDGPSDRARAAVLQHFRRKATAVGLSSAELEKLMHRIDIDETRAGHYLLTPTPDFVRIVGTGAVKTVIPQGIADPADVDRRSESSR